MVLPLSTLSAVVQIKWYIYIYIYIYVNLRPTSNLSYISKLVQTAVADQLKVHLLNNNLYPDLQALYRKYYSTETALLKFCNDILLNMNQQRVTLLIMLDLSAAFVSVHHGTFLPGVHQSNLNITFVALTCIDFGLEKRT